MRYNLLLITILFVLQLNGQEIQTTPKVKHSFYMGGGIFGEGGNGDYSGWSTAIGYKMYFPNRFILGVEYTMEQSRLKASQGTDENITYRRGLKAQSVSIHLGIHFLRKEHFDFSLIIIPHINHQQYTIEKYNIEKDEHTIDKPQSLFLFMPIIAYRIEFFYKFNQQHAIGLTADLLAEMSMDGFGDILGAEFQVVGRALLHYRFTIPRR